MSQVQPGKGAGQRPATGSRRPPSANPKPGRGAGRPGSGPGTGSKGRGKSAARPGTPVQSAPPRRFAPSTMAFAGVAAVVLVVVVLVIVKVTGGSNSPSASQGGPSDTNAPASLVHQVASIPDSVFQAVGVPSSVTAPKVLKGQPPLTSSGKPEVLYVGAEFCPYCAAERWALVAAFSRFGTFSNLQETTSSPYDVYPQTATFSFHGATYTSDVVQFTTREHQANDQSATKGRGVLEQLTPAEQNLWSKYSAQFGINTGYPFVDFGNKIFVLGPAYSPQILAGLSQDVIAAKLSNPSDPVTQAVVGEANYITAAICSLSGQQPGSVCNASGTTEAAKALGLS